MPEPAPLAVPPGPHTPGCRPQPCTRGFLCTLASLPSLPAPTLLATPPRHCSQSAHPLSSAPLVLDSVMQSGREPQPGLSVQPDTSWCPEETPSLLWGLDPVFLAFAKLYVRDILDLKESCQVPGIFLYNGHPIKQVDVLGTVVAVRERDAFYGYGVDDSTGVINCVCWKPLSSTEAFSATPSTAREPSLSSQLRKLRETTAQRMKVEIGDLIRIRGYVRTYREEREIHATAYYKVDDPVWSVQTARMLELPTLYRKVYDQPFCSPALQEEEAPSNPGTLDLPGLTCLLSEKASEFLVEHRVKTFYQQELEVVESLLSLANQPVTLGACSDQEVFRKDTTPKAIHGIFKNAIQLLQEKGLVFQKDGGFESLYYVTREDKGLHRKIHQIIQEDCQKPKHADKGCHFLHILACARLRVLPGLSEAVLQRVLELLEDQSDIVSTTERCYAAF
ncbi:CST complex subunit STN1 [Carlito syrichta]|uniref:CST complex subunit STN1 n=1 Tax=Carlito syrichta TaxID=1868482 RepID=A0A3Q0DPH9_CARSF|nr:CST complex subunit STN1 [Carlito syrichta]